MKLSRLLEAEQATHPTNPSVIRTVMANVKGWEEDFDWVLSADGIVTEAPNVGSLDLMLPTQWERIPVKFGAFPSADYKLYRCKLGTLENSPTVVKNMVMQGGVRGASLRGGPREVKGDLSIIDCALTSLAGAPEKVGGIMLLRDLHRITSLHGLENLTVDKLEIGSCGLTSFDGMPKHVESAIFISELDQLEAIRFPRGFTMGPQGVLRIGASMVSKLSPTLVTVPGLTEIDWTWSSVGYRDDVLRVFNKYLKLPKTTHTYLGLQTELIDKDMDWLAEL